MGCSLSIYDLLNNLVDFARSALQPSSRAISTLRYMASPVICLLSLRRHKHGNTHTYTPSRRYAGRHTRPLRQSMATHAVCVHLPATPQQKYLPQRLLPLSDLRSLGGSRTLGIVSRCPRLSLFLGSCRSLRDSDSIAGRRSRLTAALLACCRCVH